MLDLSVGEIVLICVTVAGFIGAAAVMKYRQDASEKRRAEDTETAEKKRDEDRKFVENEVKRNREWFDRELARVEKAHKEDITKLETEDRMQRDSWVNHNMASEGMRESFTRMETNYEHTTSDIKEIKESLREIKQNGYSQKD